MKQVIIGIIAMVVLIIIAPFSAHSEPQIQTENDKVIKWLMDNNIDLYGRINNEIQRPEKIIKDIPLDASFQNWLKAECENRNIDFYMVVAIMYNESRYQPNVTNDDTSCMGLMQIAPEYHKRYTSDGKPLNMYSPCINVIEGLDTLQEFYSWCDDWQTTLYYYSGGDLNYYDLIMQKANELRNNQSESD